MMRGCAVAKRTDAKPEVVLVAPQLVSPWNYARRADVDPPMGLLSIGSLLHERGFQVTIIDACVNPDYMEEVEAALERRPLYVGISAMTSQLANGLEIARFVREHRPDIPLVWGGVHPSLFPHQTVRHPLVDVAVLREGEYAALELAQAYAETAKPDLARIRGLAYEEDGRVRLTELRPYSPLDELPFPNYDLLEVERYFYPDLEPGKTNRQRTLMLHTGTGCLFRCAFCVNPILYQRRYYPKSAGRILEEMAYLKQRYGVEYIVFRDEDFFSRKARVRDLVQGIRERGIQVGWYANCRASYFRPTYLWDDTLADLRAAGCDRLAIGVESGSQRVLDEIIRKDITLEQVEATAELCHRHGIHVGYSFIIGVPGETREEMIATLHFMKRLKTIQPDCYFFGPQVFRPYPGAELYDRAVEYGFHQPERLDDWVEAVSERTGFLDAQSLLWIEDVRFVQQVSVLRSFFFKRWGEVWRAPLDWRYPVRVAVTALAKFRLRFNFWALPVELLGYRAYHDVLRPLILRWHARRRARRSAR